mmetsp:Transcript_23612/g.41837  ORF Transcript_23612/g.41837 Transcript_23612/m.41837 type:complete len:191 (+) Transcript_23612:400-972(+)
MEETRYVSGQWVSPIHGTGAYWPIPNRADATQGLTAQSRSALLLPRCDAQRIGRLPLTVLLFLVVGGIAGIALALHLLGLSATKKLDLNMLRPEWLRHFPTDTFAHESSFDVMINMKADRGVLRSDQGYGLIWTMGADTSARRLAHVAWTETADGLTFAFNDPAAPKVSVQLSKNERAVWLAYMRKINGQ